MRKFINNLLFGLRVLYLSVKYNLVYNYDLFLAMTLLDWIKIKRHRGSFPILHNDIEKSKNKFYKDLDFLENTLYNYINSVIDPENHDFDYTRLHIAFDILKNYFTYFWI